MKRGDPLLNHIRLERRWQKANRRLSTLRHGRLCAAELNRREGELLDVLDTVEFELGQLASDGRAAKQK